MIDLHTHTNNSDGSNSTIELLQKAESAGVKILSITDHNNCLAYEELKNIDIRKHFSGTIIAGVEFYAVCMGRNIELLGYGVDVDIINKEVKNLYLSFEETEYVIAKNLIAKCKSLGVELEENLIDKFDIKKERIFEFIFKQLIKNEENRKFFKVEEAWGNWYKFARLEFSNPNSNFFMNPGLITPSFEVVSDLIKKAGGLIFVAHIFEYGDAMKIFDYINNHHKVDGYECYYPTFSQDQIKFLTDYCKANNLFMSGGSDYHGKIKPQISLGTGINNNLIVPEKEINKWINLCKTIE